MPLVRSFSWLVSLLYVGISHGLNPCLDSTSPSFKCALNQNSLNLDDCGLTDDDAADITSCIKSFESTAISSSMNFDNNSLTAISDDWFVGLSELQIISIEDNEIAQLNLGIFDDLWRLEGLWINNNKLTTLPAPGLFSNGAGSTNVENGWVELVLVFDGNLFSDLPSDLFTGASVSEVSMAGCFSGELPFGDIFSGLGDLDYMDLSFNGLTTLPENVFSGGLVELRGLDLNDNDLTSLPENVFDGLELSRLDLTGNDNLECIPPVTANLISFPGSYDEAACEGTCSDGIQSGDVCCLESCGECGGKGCGSRPGGSTGCCVGRITDNGVLCSETNGAPCIIDRDIEATTCSNGISGVQQGDVCCSETCGTCGGAGCGRRSGGKSSCCVGTISASGMLCSESGAAPCIVDDGV